MSPELIESMNAERLSAEQREEMHEQARQAQEKHAREQDKINAEKRRPLYSDVEQLIVPGFLSQQVRIGDTVICIRSVSPGDMTILRHRVPADASDRVWKEWAIATTTWMIDGQILFEDQNAVVRVRRALQHLPNAALDSLWTIQAGLLNRVAKALGRVEAFSYEDYSRVLWRFAGQQSPVRDEFVGIPGVARLGTNLIQRMWISFNLAEDDRISDTQRWAEAKLVASATSPKGIRKLNSADEQRWKQEQDRRRTFLNKLYYDEIGWQERQDELVFQPHSADELVEQWRRWQAGEKDLHDIVVDTWKDKYRSSWQAREDEQRARAEAREAARREQEETHSSGLVAYTPEQFRELFQNKPRHTHHVENNIHARRLFDRYLRSDLATGEGHVSEQSEGPSLNDQIRDRAANLRDGSPIPPKNRER